MLETWHELLQNLPFEWAQYAFMRNALLAFLIIAPLFAMLGCLVINNQMAFFSDAIGHATLTGIALGVLFGLADADMPWAIMAFAVALALLVSALRRYSAVSTDTLIGLVMSFAVALGVVLLSRGQRFSEYASFLTGSILFINESDIRRVAGVLAVVTVVWILCFNRFLLTFLNRPLAQSRGVWVWTQEACFASLVAVVVATSISWVGLLVVNSMLIIPAATARNLATTARQYFFIAIAASLAAGIPGLFLSYAWDTAPGATMVLLSMVFYLLSLFLRR